MSAIAPAQSLAAATYQLIPLSLLKPSPTNPRKHIDKAALQELTASVREQGVLQPILVRSLNGKGVFEIVTGERRWRAAQAAELPEIPAIVRELTDSRVLEIQVIENLQRSDLHALEEAQGYQQLLSKSKSYDIAKIAERVGRPAEYVRDRLKLLSLTADAQKLFREGQIAAGHAVILSRLSPADQARVMDKKTGGLFTHEKTLWVRDDDDSGEHYKVVTARELQGWINGHVKLTAQEQELPELFPVTSAKIQGAEEIAEKVVHITYENHIQEDARDGSKVFGPRSWKRADGNAKTCAVSVLGVIVVGSGRGEAFRVCLDKKGCTTHWGAEMREAKKRAQAAEKGGKTGEDRHAIALQKQKEDQALEDAARKRWKLAVPAILAALAESVKKQPAGSKSALGQLVLQKIAWDEHQSATAARFVPRGNSAEDLVRHAAFIVLCEKAGQYSAHRDFSKTAKAFVGIDIKKVLDEAVPLAEAAAAPATKKDGAAKKSSKRKGRR